MAKLFVVAFAVLCVFDTVYGTNNGLTCSVDTLANDVEASVVSCLSHKPAIMFRMLKYINHPERMEQIQFVCENQDIAAYLMSCMVQEFTKKCLPEEAQEVVRKVLPDEKGWKKIIHFVCDNKKVLGERCMSPGDTQKFLQCYQAELSGATSSIVAAGTSKNVNPLICEAVAMDERCLVANKGSCTDDYLKMVLELMDMVVNVPDCPTVIQKDTKMAGALSSILLQGHPLIFRPQGEAKYKVNN